MKNAADRATIKRLIKQVFFYFSSNISFIRIPAVFFCLINLRIVYRILVAAIQHVQCARTALSYRWIIPEP